MDQVMEVMDLDNLEKKGPSDKRKEVMDQVIQIIYHPIHNPKGRSPPSGPQRSIVNGPVLLRIPWIKCCLFQLPK